MTPQEQELLFYCAQVCKEVIADDIRKNGMTQTEVRGDARIMKIDQLIQEINKSNKN